jgi:dUTP pyrophosphatase
MNNQAYISASALHNNSHTPTSYYLACLSSPGAVLPKRAHPTDAGADLSAFLPDGAVVIEPGQRKLIDTGIAIKIPAGFGGFVHSRSGHAKLGISLANRTGIIDTEYRGNIKVFLENNSNEPFTVNNGDRIAQLVISPVLLCTFSDIWNDTDRGTGGFGSTGKN